MYHVPGMQVHFWLVLDCILLCIYWKHNLKHASIVQGGRKITGSDVVGAQQSSYWAHGRLEGSEIQWVQTNNYKFHTFHSGQFHPSLHPRPPFQFSIMQLSVAEEAVTTVAKNMQTQYEGKGSLVYIHTADCTSCRKELIVQNHNLTRLPAWNLLDNYIVVNLDIQ